MGFFSSRKNEDDTTTTVVKVIRSRFYGKSKTARSSPEPPVIAFHAQGTASAILSPPPPPSSSKSIKTSKSTPFLSVQATSKDKDRTITKRKSAADTHTPSSPVKTLHDASSVRSSGSAMQSPRKPTSNVTVTLAQRLNELAAANAEGLLNDDEYRLLRQDLFERFAAKSSVPTENPVVPISPSPSRPLPRSSDRRTSNVSSRPSSQFTVDVASSSSPRKASGRSSVSDLFRKQTNGHSREPSDTSSMQSHNSTTPNRFSRMSRMITRNTSSESLGTDALSISSRTGAMTIDGSSSLSSPSRNRGRSFAGNSSGSLRNAPPPSSFHARSTLSEHNSFSGALNSPSDDENIRTSKQIKEEIAAIEAEGRRLADAFNGLELSTLTKRQKHPVGMGVDDTAPGSTYTLIPESKLRRVHGPDSDGMSVRSDSTSASGAKSTFSGRTGLRGQISGSFKSGSLRRKNSMSSMSSGRYAPGSSKSGLAPPLPPFSSQLGQLGHASNSSLNLGRSSGNLPMMSVPEDEVRSLSSTLQDAELMDAEMEEIRRRRDEVSKRYDARLEYLRAKLKGAQLHEKLMKK